MSVLSELKLLHPCLRSRIHRIHSLSQPKPPSNNSGFVLYLPQVLLRYKQNPAFAVACHAANELNVPLVVLAVVLDDASHSRNQPHRSPPSNNISSAAVVMTSRRLAFTLEALSETCTKWSHHGAAVGIRIHSPKGRNPDHLSLCTKARLVVTDEPFVSPYTTFVARVEEACRKSNVECLRVDGSCTVPPAQVLKRRSSNNSVIKYDVVPAKAYLWQNKTEHLRESHLNAAMEGHFDAPDLTIKVNDDILFGESNSDDDAMHNNLKDVFPSRWQAKPSNGEALERCALPSAPDVRPFTSRELETLSTTSEAAASTPKKDRYADFALNWAGADSTVPPCKQTIGTTSQGMQRWNNFNLSEYGKKRNDAKLVHSVSRMSAYLNLGIVSIFRLVWEVKRAQKQQSKKTDSTKRSKWGKSGPDKYEEEIVKWREMSYAHAFARADYDDVGSLPNWALSCLNNHRSGRGGHTLQQLTNGTTGDTKWDAMQQYLVRTGELHNNGKSCNSFLQTCLCLLAATNLTQLYTMQ